MTRKKGLQKLNSASRIKLPAIARDLGVCSDQQEPSAEVPGTGQEQISREVDEPIQECSQHDFDDVFTSQIDEFLSTSTTDTVAAGSSNIDDLLATLDELLPSGVT
ncbi:hypothetical protein R1flu_013601 [Riccia fluitans]|uniref:Uncharacterized protein n=1 Tax=Riccia fluitans TaxID=41844 RepID=A0ABD1YEG5_9MARC